jgi:hypothetical protein
MHTVRVMMLTSLSVALTACAALTPGGERPEFGESVRHMIQVQTYAPGDEVPSLKGDNAAEAMEAYRRDTGTRERFGKGLMGLE